MSGATFAGSYASATPLRERVVLYGGADALWSGFVDDLWAWDGQVWTNICEDCTGLPRVLAPLVYDPLSGRLVMTGGWNGTENDGTWEYDAEGFQRMSERPGPRDSAGMTYDSNRDVILQYGGNGPSCSGDCSETLEYER